MKDDVFWFDIAMDDSQRVDFVDSFTDLLDNRCNFCLCHWFGSLELMEELSSCSDFQNDVDMGFIIEISVHFDDVRVVEVHLDLQLSDELLDDVLVF